MRRQIENHLADIRQKRGLSAAQLAKAAGVTRQTIYAMEAGTYIPNTAVALKLARTLDAAVEDLFALAPDEAAEAEFDEAQAQLLPGSEVPGPGQPVQLCRVDQRLMACPPAAAWYFPAADAVVSAARVRAGKVDVRVLPEAEEARRLLVAGCDPGMSVLARHALRHGVELVLAHRNSSQSLKLLKEGCVHVAGTHLRDELSGESNIPAIGRIFAKGQVAVVSFAIWEEGIVTERGNPQAIRGVEDLARAGVTIVNREPGAGSRLLLDSHLKRLGLSADDVRGYDCIAYGHLPAAAQVQAGRASACIATRAAARAFGLGFIPLATERYDLAVRRRHLELPAMQTLFDTLARSSFRRELEFLGGYDTRPAGERLL
jgi:molybdate-binding protein/DNA-binding XRE family transcriptional regulator